MAGRKPAAKIAPQPDDFRTQRPHNCYSCSWEPVTKEGHIIGYRLKYAHSSCYRGHPRRES